MPIDDRQERERRVKLLLATLDSYVPPPRVPTPTDVSRGFSMLPQRLTCPDCLANDFRAGHRDCETCGGRGVVVVDVERDPYDTGVSKFDPYEDRRRDEARARDAVLIRLETNARIRAGDLVDEAERWEIDRARLERAGSYGQLREVLRWLAHTSTDVHRATMLLHATPYGMVTPTHRMRVLADVGICWLTERMPASIRVPYWVDPERATKLVERERTVAILHADGWSARRIAKEMKLSLKAVKKQLHALPASGPAGTVGQLAHPSGKRPAFGADTGGVSPDNRE